MDMNVSLTAVGLLWNASDLISKLHSKLPLEAVAADSSSPAPSPSFKIDAVQYEELIRQLFGALQVLAVASSQHWGPHIAISIPAKHYASCWSC